MRVVYYLQRLSDEAIKIGTTEDLKRRIRQLTRLYGPLRLWGAEPGSYRLERQRHERFSAHRITGEWFQYCGDIAAHAALLPELPPEPPRMTMNRWVPIVISADELAYLQATNFGRCEAER